MRKKAGFDLGRADVAYLRNVTDGLCWRWMHEYSSESAIILILLVASGNALWVLILAMARHAYEGRDFLASIILFITVASGFFGCVVRTLNKTTVTIQNGFLQVRHHPIPWGKNYTIQTSDIQGLYIELHRVRNKTGIQVSYKVMAQHTYHLPTSLLHVRSLAHAQAIEAWISQRLGVSCGPLQ